MAAGRGAGAVRPDARADARAAAHLRADARADVDEAADDGEAFHGADGADALPDLITDISTDDHTGSKCEFRTDAATFPCPDAATYAYAFGHAYYINADHGRTKPRAVSKSNGFLHRSRGDRHGHGLYCARALFGELEDVRS